MLERARKDTAVAGAISPALSLPGPIAFASAIDRHCDYSPLVSVIIPLFGTERYVEKCVRSVMEQRYRRIEIICVDDCSPDNSAAIVERLMAEDGRIRLIRHETNLGLGGARNTGLRASHAEWVASVDSDDSVEPDFIRALVAGTDRGKHDVVVCGYASVDEDGATNGKHATRIKTVRVEPGTDVFRISNPAFWNKLWRRSLYTENNIWFPNYVYHQDQATTGRIYSRARSINFIGGAPYKYLDRPGSAVNSFSDKHLIDRIRVLDVIKDHFIADESYQRRKPHADRLLLSASAYHASMVAKQNDLSDPRIAQYLRHYLIIRNGYRDHDDRIRSLAPHQILAELVDFDRPPQPAVDPATLRWQNPRILVLTLESGENEFEMSKQAMAQQTFRGFDHKVISGMGNAEAHAALYDEILSRSNDYDLFIKLDADMVFARTTALQDILAEFQRNHTLDHYIVPCKDFMTGRRIFGKHVFSNRVRWNKAPTGINYDSNPQRPGTRKTREFSAPSLVLHSPDPHDFQAFHFGAHRALKIRQAADPSIEYSPAWVRYHWVTLRRVWKRYKDQKDRRFGLALVAADLIFSGKLSVEAHNYRDETLREQFDLWASADNEKILSHLRTKWSSSPQQWIYAMRSIGAGPSFSMLTAKKIN